MYYCIWAFCPSAVVLQKVQSAAARLAKLPVVRSACTKLSVLYIDTKCSHPNLKSACEVLESSVTAIGAAACDRVSHVIVKLEPQSEYCQAADVDVSRGLKEAARGFTLGV